MASFTVDLHEDDPESVERGEYAPAGWYHCRLKDVFEDEKNASRTIFKFEILDPTFRGKVVKDQIDSPDSVDADKAPIIRRRQKLLAKRLGLLDVQDYGNEAPVEKDWADAIGSEYLVHVEQRTYKKRDGSEASIASIAFDGVYPLDYPKDRFPKEFREKFIGEFGEVLTGPDTSEKPAKGEKKAAAAAAASSPPAASTAAKPKPRFTTDDL